MIETTLPVARDLWATMSAPAPAPLQEQMATLQSENTALRPTVLWRTGRFRSDSPAGSRFAERLLTAVATFRQQGRPLLAFLVAAEEAALHGTAAPSLLPAPLGD